MRVAAAILAAGTLIAACGSTPVPTTPAPASAPPSAPASTAPTEAPATPGASASLTGEFPVEDPTLLANTLYASGLGALQLARVGILVTESAPGIPTVGEISTDQVRQYLVASALALATRPSES